MCRGGDFVKQRKVGIGTLSVILVCIAIIWGTQWNDGRNVTGIGVAILRYIGLERLVLSNLNLPYLFTYIFTIPAFFIGRKYNEHWGAKAGRILSAMYALFCLFAIPWRLIFK